MARKGREPLAEAPPPAASSSEEDESSSGEEEEPEQELVQDLKVTEKQPTSSEEEEEDDDEEEEEEDEEEENFKENTESPPPSKALTQKKPESPKRAALANATVLASPAPSTKRKGSVNEKGTQKKAKMEKVEATGDEGKKPLFQRLWSDEDEIAILQGMIDYKAKKGIDPTADTDGFMKFIKYGLHADVNRRQIMSKFRTLKRKFETSKKKKKIADPHGIKVFELSKRIWESDEVKSNGGVDGKDSNSKSRSVKKKGSNSEKSNGVAKDFNNGIVSEDVKEEKVQKWEVSKCEKKEQKLENSGSYVFMKENLNLLAEEDKVKLEEKWRKQNVAEVEVYLTRLDLIKELTQKTLDAMKST